MLDASDPDFIENVSPFLGWLVDSHFGLDKTSETISAFAKYVDMVNFLFKRDEFLNCVMHPFGT